MEYEKYYYGMNIIWWILWVILLIWIFVLPYDIPGQKRSKESALDILNKRYAAGEITEEEYLHHKRNITRIKKRIKF